MKIEWELRQLVSWEKILQSHSAIVIPCTMLIKSIELFQTVNILLKSEIWPNTDRQSKPKSEKISGRSMGSDWEYWFSPHRGLFTLKFWIIMIEVSYILILGQVVTDQIIIPKDVKEFQLLMILFEQHICTVHIYNDNICCICIYFSK